MSEITGNIDTESVDLSGLAESIPIFFSKSEKVYSSTSISTPTAEHMHNNDLAVPSESAKSLLEFLKISSAHARATNIISQCVSGFGYTLQTDDNSKLESSEKAFKEFLDLLSLPSGKKLSFGEMNRLLIRSYVILERFSLEVSRVFGKATKIFYHNLKNTFVKKDFSGYEQVVEKDGTTESRPYANYKEGDPFIHELHGVWNYSEIDDYYPVPSYLPTLGKMTINKLSEQYNLYWFENNTRPDWALIIEGGELSSEGKKNVREHLSNLKGTHNAGKVLYISIPGGMDGKTVKARLEKMNTIREGSFQEETKINDRAIYNMHGIPEALSGIESHSSSFGEKSTGALKQFLQIDIRPLQQMLANFWEDFFFQETGIKITLTFNTLDLTDKKQDADIEKLKAEIVEIYKRLGSLKLYNEYRKRNKLEEFTEKDWKNFVLEGDSGGYTGGGLAA